MNIHICITVIVLAGAALPAFVDADVFPTISKVLVGDTINITCKAENSSLLYFNFDGNKRISDEHIEVIDNSTIRLVIKNATLDDGGTYKCLQNGTGLFFGRASLSRANWLSRGYCWQSS
jgi:hypothetical protein